MYYPRKLATDLEKHISTKQIIVLTGMRRVGKTTLLKELFKKVKSNNKAFLDIENPLEQKIFEEVDYNNIWANLKPYQLSSKQKAFLFLDEIQSMPGIVRAIKYLYDHYRVKFFVTGSSSFYLKNLFPESLAGRKYIFELYPLDFEEFLIFKNQPKKFNQSFFQKEKKKNYISFEKVKKLYDEYLEFGGFPEVVLEEDYSLKPKQLEDIFKSYFEKDVKNLADFREINIFRDLIFLLMQRVGSKLEISKLASELGISRETVYSYVSFLEGTYFISLISPFTLNVDREISGSRKIYFCDTGMVNHLAKISEGSLLENSIFNNLRKYGRLNYYQKRSGAEIDFILNQKVALEVKNRGTEGEYKKLIKMVNDLRLREGYLLTREFNKNKGFIPVIEI